MSKSTTVAACIGTIAVAIVLTASLPPLWHLLPIPVAAVFLTAILFLFTVRTAQ